MVGKQPDRDALRVIFAESNRFRHLTLDLSLLRYGDIPTQGFTQLRVTGPRGSTDVGSLRAIFSSAPHLRCVVWYCAGDPGPIKVNGRQLHTLSLRGNCFPVTRVLEVLTACPNIRDAVIILRGKQDHIPMPSTERILLPELRSLTLGGTKDLAHLLASVQAPRLSYLYVHWKFPDDPEACGLEALESFLAYSTHLEVMALYLLLKAEDGLIRIITNNQNLRRLVVTCQRPFITHKTFQLLTRQEHGRYVLPHLAQLEFQGRLDVTDEVVIRMIESRVSPPEYTSHSRRACTLRFICLDQCKPMAEESISRLQTICRDSGLKAEGAFADPTDL